MSGRSRGAEGNRGRPWSSLPTWSSVNRGYKGDTSLKKFNGHPHLDTFLPLLDCTGPLQSGAGFTEALFSLPEPQRNCYT